MSYQKAADLLRLALDLAGSHMGLQLSEIDRLASSEGKSARRNTQRLLEALRDLFGDKLVEVTDFDGRKRVKLERGRLHDFIDLEADELASLDHAITALKAQNDSADAERLGRLRTKVRLLAPEKSRRKIEVDYEALLASSSVIIRPGPRPKIDAGTMGPITEALLSLKQLAFCYPRAGGCEERVVDPYGVLMGHRVYLIAQQAGSSWGEPPVWRVDRMRDVHVVEHPASIPADFDLQSFSRRAFGAFHSTKEYGEVVWRFTAKAAESARSFHFHPDQVFEEDGEGSLTVKFTASGHLEMAWFLYAWGDQVEVVAPQSLKNLVDGHRRSDFPGMP
ncbi:WYL domain-containing protein [Devosia sp. 919]|uniref:helix-turn-helix transcriptional regulator n=1 Tax=Devosia sp. 919 TaxID=2726065 RepID=UPI001553D7DE|nr:WYL domain-containing protein [Devosia sp. 919]